MVSAVFHSPASLPLPRAGEGRGEGAVPKTPHPRPLPASGEREPTTSPKLNEQRIPFDWRAVWLRVLPPVLGLGFLVGIWAIVSMKTGANFPTPLETFKQAVDVFSDPFYQKGPN